MTTIPTKAATIFGSVLLVGGLAVGGAAVPAFAHTPAVSADCTSLSMKFESYNVIAAKPASGGKPAVAADATPNTVTVTIDGVASAPVKFGKTYSSTIALDGQRPHTYSVVLGTHDGYDRTFADKTVACPTPTPSVPPVTSTPTPTPSVPPVTSTPTPTPSVPPVTSTPTPSVPPVTPTPTPIVPSVSETPAPIVPPANATPTPTATAVTPAAVTAPAPTPAASTRELAETGVSTWSVPAIAASVLAMLLGAGLLLARRFRRA
ncbi:LPXTG cell wall anchor domain-containing protein [Cryobacterium zongtaii]|uniref:LPXTG cell wall anchor domain-containing protein n=1 Tax=Cryobacterium zongtaii TaxID=1259217 RepID=UPI00105711EB|nr:LPXTG cell wall anchor domain-containing protein [Cryobacterium zongtaii]